MITVYNDPWLIDFLKVCSKMPQDEREQLEAFTGQKYNVDSAAIGNFTVPGPKWVAKTPDGEPVCIAGFVPQRPGVFRDFMLTTPEVWAEHWFALTRVTRRIMDAMLKSGQAHRLECVAHHSREKAFRWYKAIGYNREATLYGFCANGADAIIFSKVRH